jgi:hypothetical protein
MAAAVKKGIGAFGDGVLNGVAALGRGLDRNDPLTGSLFRRFTSCSAATELIGARFVKPETPLQWDVLATFGV